MATVADYTIARITYKTAAISSARHIGGYAIALQCGLLCHTTQPTVIIVTCDACRRHDIEILNGGILHEAEQPVVIRRLAIDKQPSYSVVVAVEHTAEGRVLHAYRLPALRRVVV